MSHSVFTQKKVTILLQSFKGVQYLQKVDNECDCVINRSSVNHSTRLNYTRPIISRLSLLEKRRVRTRVLHAQDCAKTFTIDCEILAGKATQLLLLFHIKLKANKIRSH